MNTETHAFEEGQRDARLTNVEREVHEIRQTQKVQGRVLYLICGAILLAQFVIPLAVTVYDLAKQ